MKNIFNCNKYYNEKYKNELNFRYCLVWNIFWYLMKKDSNFWGEKNELCIVLVYLVLENFY